MPEKKEILAIVPARGGSKGIPQKNIHLLNGKPLIQYTIDAIGESRMLTRSILSSDSQEIIDLAVRGGLDAPFVRPEELSRDDTPSLPVIEHAVAWLREKENYTPDVIVLLQPTSPLRRGEHIDGALQAFMGSDADSIVSVVKVPHRDNPQSIMEKAGEGRGGGFFLKKYMDYDEKKSLRQLMPTYYARNGAAIYAFTRECLLKKKSLYGDKILGYEMSPEDSQDIDSPLDLQICEFLLKRKDEQQ